MSASARRRHHDLFNNPRPAVALKPATGVTCALPPEGKPKPDNDHGRPPQFAKARKPGRDQAALSDEAETTPFGRAPIAVP